MPRAVVILALWGALLAGGASAAAQAPVPALAFVGRPVASVSLEVEGRPTDDHVLRGLIETRIGMPLSVAEIRESMTHLFDLGRFEGVAVRADDAPGGGVALTYELRPLHAVSELIFRGDTGLSADDLRRVVIERYTKAPPAGRADAAARTLEQYLARRGFLSANVTPTLDVRHDPDRTRLIFTVQAGPRARVGTVKVTGTSDNARVAARLGLNAGAAFDPDRFTQRVTDYVQSLRRAGYYEATADPVTTPRARGEVVDVTVEVRRGPSVRLAFEGDPLPKNRLGDLVPIAREGSVDEDLLEDSDIRIRDYLLELGYPKAKVSHRREQRDSVETITFTVNRGARYVVDSVEISGNANIPLEQLRPLIVIKRGEPFVERKLTTAIAAIKREYRQKGYTAAAVDVGNRETAPASPGDVGHVEVRLVVREGVLTRVGTIAIEGNANASAADLRAVMKVHSGGVFYEPAVAADRESVLLYYLNRGYASATVAVDLQWSPDRSQVNLLYRVSEQAPVIVDHVIVVGNTKTSEETIRRELLVQEGKPLGYDDLIESQRRLSALGLFRRVRISEAPHGNDPGRDVVVTVEEANRTSLAYGAGAEVTPVTTAGAGGIAAQRYDVAPRGSFEIGRRNLWGRNRSVNLFTRVSFRPRGRAIEAEGAQYGINEYRVVGTYRELGALGSRVDVATNAFVEQAVRSTFNFRRQGVNAEALRRISPFVRMALRYTLGRTELLDAEQIPPELQLEIDRLFPQVRLSSLSAAVYRDTRDDPLEPSRGLLLAEDSELAMRSIGSEVGFAKLFVQAFSFRQLPTRRRVIFASAARLGLARPFAQDVNGLVVSALPASERFFAGGSTTVRGFALDRLGTAETISPTGFPKGGNAVVILNAELRTLLWRDFGVVGFIDAGNVFARASDFDLGALRVSPGVGLRYRSPIGPIRFDVGFKLAPRELSPGRFEGRTAYHISVGHAF